MATSKVVNLSDVFGKNNDTNKFVTRYLQTTHCDLFFADAAIFVEGAAENMLLPHFIRLKYQDLYQRYISILSVNGRHLHRLNPLIEKLCIPTLVITDLDPAENFGHHRGVNPKRGRDYISSNYAITDWLIKENALDKLFDIPPEKKEINYKTPFDYVIRIAYQTPIVIELNSSKQEFIPSTFEDSLIYTNWEIFKRIKADDLGTIIKKVNSELNSSKTSDEICNSIYETLHNKSAEKAEFALDIIWCCLKPVDKMKRV